VQNAFRSSKILLIFRKNQAKSKTRIIHFPNLITDNNARASLILHAICSDILFFPEKQYLT